MLSSLHWFYAQFSFQPFTAKVIYEDMFMFFLTFDSANEILWCVHLNETSLAVLLHGTICFSLFYKMKFGISL